jgi:hypothetical protein
LADRADDHRQHGPNEVQFTAAAGGGIFRWSDVVPAIAE